MRQETIDNQTATSSSAGDDNATAEYGLFWGDDMLKAPKQKEYLVDNFIRTNDVVFITATAGVGKSILCLQLIAALTSGEKFLNEFKVPKPLNVLYVQTEGDRVETIDRILAMEEGVKFNHKKWVHYNAAGVSLNTSEGFDVFFKTVQVPQINYDVIIIDPLYTTLKGSMNSDEVAGDWVRNIRRLRRKYDCAFVIVHHESEKTRMSEGKIIPISKKNLMGSSMWAAFTSINYKLHQHMGLHILDCGKSRGDGMIDTLKLRMIEPSPLMYVIADDDYTVAESRILEVLKNAKEPLFARSLVTETGLSRATVYRVLSKFDGELIARIGEKHNTKFIYTGGADAKTKTESGRCDGQDDDSNA